MTDVPDLKDELERKVADALVRILDEAQRGELDPQTARAALRALWDAASGLISKELMEMLAASIDAVGELQIHPRVIWRARGEDLMAIMMPEQDHPNIEVVLLNRGKISRKRYSADEFTLREMTTKMNILLSQAAKAGFKPIDS